MWKNVLIPFYKIHKKHIDLNVHLSTHREDDLKGSRIQDLRQGRRFHNISYGSIYYS